MRSPVTAVIQSFNALTEDEKKLCLDFIAPEPEPEPPAKQKRTRKKKAETQAAQKRGLPGTAASNGALCVAMLPESGKICGAPEDDALHDPELQYANSHPFASSVATAAQKSKRKAAAANITQNLEIEKAAAISAGS